MANRRFSRGSSASPSINASTLDDISIDTSLTSPSTLFNDIPSTDSTIPEQFILVVGGLGYIGSHTTLELLKEGYNVAVIDDLSNAYRNVLESLLIITAEHCRLTNKRIPLLKFHEMDYKSAQVESVLSAYRLPSGASQISGVIHFAAFKSVEESIHSPLAYYDNNVCGLVSFLTLLSKFSIKTFVFSSSATVYGTKANDGIPLAENFAVHTPTPVVDSCTGSSYVQASGAMGLTNPYGRTKWMCESILADLAVADPTWCITALRYFNPVGCHPSGRIGEHPRQTPTNLVPVILQVMRGERQHLEIYGTDWETKDGTAVRDYIHVVDLAKGHVAALTAINSKNEGKLSSFRTYNLGTGRGFTVREVVRGLEEASGRSIPAIEAGRRAGDVGYCIAGVERATQELHWNAELTLQDCCRDAWNFSVRCAELEKRSSKLDHCEDQKVKSVCTTEAVFVDVPQVSSPKANGGGSLRRLFQRRTINPRTAFHMSVS